MKEYLISLQCGGSMEDPELHYEKHEIIKANTPEEAKAIYNENHNCSYYYAALRGEVVNGFVHIPIKDFV